MATTSKTCFVIMGYGKKTDLNTARTLDLDKTYHCIIKPAIEEMSIKCIRGDEIHHSGVIDQELYNQLLFADLVIADLSTANSNAIYELGIRHALKPHTTIVIAESGLQYPFDVNHIKIMNYQHHGDHLCYEAVTAFKTDLKKTIETIIQQPKTDSPVYTFLYALQPPSIKGTSKNSNLLINFLNFIGFQLLKFSKNAINRDALNESKKTTSMMIEKESLSGWLEKAEKDLDNDNFIDAKTNLEKAKTIAPHNPYIIQKLALATYKSKYPDEVQSLNLAQNILAVLKPEQSSDPETLGLSGAIEKRLYEITTDRAHLEKSIEYYQKGFILKQDYYNGINYAYMLLKKASIQKEKNEVIADFIEAQRTYMKVIAICKKIKSDPSFVNRNDQYWIIATLAEAHFVLDDNIEHKKYIEEAKRLIDKENWMMKTTKTQISKLEEIKKQLKLKDNELIMT